MMTMKKLILFLALCISLQTFANPIDDNCPQFVVRGAPVSKLTNTQYLCKKNYAIHYRNDTKTAEYVVEHVTKESISGPARRDDDFRADSEIPKEHQSVLSDYAGNPYDRGHLAPAGNNTTSEEIMSESFFLSNMVPQVPNHNRGIWKQLETYIRNWVLEGKDIYVVTGTVYEQNHLTIGNNNVGVPTKLWKVIIDRKTAKVISFMFPNEALPVRDLPKYVTTVKAIELETKINFMPKLPAGMQKIEITPPVLSDWSGL